MRETDRTRQEVRPFKSLISLTLGTNVGFGDMKDCNRKVRQNILFSSS